MKTNTGRHSHVIGTCISHVEPVKGRMDIEEENKGKRWLFARRFMMTKTDLDHTAPGHMCMTDGKIASKDLDRKKALHGGYGHILHLQRELQDRQRQEGLLRQARTGSTLIQYVHDLNGLAMELQILMCSDSAVTRYTGLWHS